MYTGTIINDQNISKKHPRLKTTKITKHLSLSDFSYRCTSLPWKLYADLRSHKKLLGIKLTSSQDIGNYMTSCESLRMPPCRNYQILFTDRIRLKTSRIIDGSPTMNSKTM